MFDPNADTMIVQLPKAVDFNIREALVNQLSLLIHLRDKKMENVYLTDETRHDLKTLNIMIITQELIIENL